MRTAHKDDIHCSGVELMYGVPLHLPGELFDLSTSASGPQVEALDKAPPRLALPSVPHTSGHTLTRL